MGALATVAARPTDAGPAEDIAARGVAPAPPEPVEFRYVQSDTFTALLAQLRASLLVSTYQANK
ncbi:MAG TPA: hypothetical protein VFW87_25070, partial [Pirellulales bacterium]|nr:hypothetical protein [Pirellulales bacterium]